MAYTKYSLTPANNTATPPDGAPEGMLPSAVNDTMRDMMAQIRDCGDGIRDGTYTMTAAKITGGTITGVTFTGNTFSNPTITGVSTFAAGTVSAPAITTTGDTNTGIFFPAADTIAFTEGGAEAMRIDSDGDVGIGATSISRKLQISQSNATTYTGDFDAAPNQLYIVNTNTTTNAYTGLQMDVGSNSQAAISAIRTGDGEVAMAFGTRVAGVRAERMRIDSSGRVLIGTTSGTRKLTVYENAAQVDLSIVSSTTGLAVIQMGDTAADNQGQIIYRNNGDSMEFAVNAAERMRITSDGYVGVGTSTPANYGAFAIRKGVNGTWIGVSGECSFHTSDAVNSSLYVIHSSANSTTTFIGTDAGGRLQMFCSASAAGGVYLANGGTSWTSASDERVKENLAPIQNGLEKVTSLRAVTGNFINDENKKSRAFLIAQDVQKVFPQAVDSSNPDELGLAYTDVIPLLVAAMKEQQAMIEELKQEVAALKAK